jgi:hypothetical protein
MGKLGNVKEWLVVHVIVVYLFYKEVLIAAPANVLHVKKYRKEEMVFLMVKVFLKCEVHHIRMV